jgi:hypothetical protein
MDANDGAATELRDDQQVRVVRRPVVQHELEVARGSTA